MNTETIAPATETRVAEYSPTAAALAELAQRFRGVVFDVATTKGDKEARAARLELVRLRTGLEAKRRELKAPALERSRLIDAEASRISSAITELETPIDQQIRAEEARKEMERRAKAEAEQNRVEALVERVANISAIAFDVEGDEPVSFSDAIAELEAIAVDDSFAEFQPAAAKAKQDALERLREQHRRAVAAEEERAQLARERAELERQKAEREQEQRAALVAAAEERRAADEAAAAERRRADEAAAEQRRQQEKVDQQAREAHAALQKRIDDEAAEQRRADQQRVQAEMQRLAEERAEIQRRQAAEKVAETERLRVEQAKFDRLHKAGPAMFRALVKWQLAEKTDDSKELQEARELRDAAIEAAN